MKQRRRSGRLFIVLVAVVAVAVSSWGVSVESTAPAAAASAAEAGLDPGVPEVAARPLPTLSEPADPAAAIDSLPRGVAAVPVGTAAVELTGGWVEVPGLPVEVRAAEQGGRPGAA